MPTKFVDVRTDNVSFGYRAYDDHDQCYDNCLDCIPDDDLEFLRMVVRDNSNIVMGGMLDFVVDNKTGISIGDHHYQWETIKEIMEIWV